ncbi:MAG: putative peptidoglycan glycosyltransferase FtsW [Microbacteriaceae bacterium]|nr:putative peptidoglycan glycosyltransferase FtsW [Microbacteriaceae bacterium]
MNFSPFDGGITDKAALKPDSGSASTVAASGSASGGSSTVGSAPANSASQHSTPVACAQDFENMSLTSYLRRSVQALWHRKIIAFISIVTALVGFGLLMVFSASSVTSYLSNQGFWGAGAKQAAFAAVGFGLMMFLALLPLRLYQRFSPLIFLSMLLFQALVFTPLGQSRFGNRNWLNLGVLTVQPSEFLKFGLIIAVAGTISRKAKLFEKDWKHELIPIVFPGGLLALGLVVLGHDLGTASIMSMVLFGCMYFGGISWKSLRVLVAGAVLAAAFFVFTSQNRLARIMSFGGGTDDYSGLDWQPTHGIWALASGGFWGSGLGQSKAKWSWLPAADNDYIFTIIGEEFGFVGTTVTVLTYVLLAFLMLHAINTARTNFGRAIVGGVLVWIVGQGFVNICVTLKLMPVLGVPLPLISAGGTALIACLMGVGVALAVMIDSVIYAGKNGIAPEFENLTVETSLRR